MSGPCSAFVARRGKSSSLVRVAPTFSTTFAPETLRAPRTWWEPLWRFARRRTGGESMPCVPCGSISDSMGSNRSVNYHGKVVMVEAAVSVIAADAGGNAGPLHPETVQSYLNALGRVFAIEDQPAWSEHLRSRSRLRRSPRRHFVDPSLAVAALRSDPDRLRADPGSFGLFFESLAVRDLRVYSQAHDAEVYHYRDNTGLEVDAIVETAGGAWMGVEIKLGGERPIEEGARNLLKLRDRVDPDRTRPSGRARGDCRRRPRLRPARRGGAGAAHRARPLNLPFRGRTATAGRRSPGRRCSSPASRRFPFWGAPE